MSDVTQMRVLAIDDDAQDVEILKRHLELIPELAVALSHVSDPVAVTGELSRADVDAIFLDYRLGGETGLEVLERVRSFGYLGPVIALTGHGDENLAAQLMRAGADDYVAKADLDPERLRRALRNGHAQHARRRVSSQNRDLVSDLSSAKRSLEDRNRRLSELYRTAHQFVDDVSHEFRTPLTVVKDFASILRDGIAGEINDEQREYLGIIINRVDDLVTMVGDMLDISKIEAGKLGVSRRTISVAETFDRTSASLERRASLASVALDLGVPDGLPDVYCDPEKAGRVIINLVVNALKFTTPDGGRVKVSAKHDPESKEVIVSVTDNGPGIPRENLKEIFERFQQTDGDFKANIRGSGLGLGISKQLVQLNLGRMTVHSVEGKGSTFSFSLPEAEPASLIQRYLDMTDVMRESAGFVSLVSAVSDPSDPTGYALVAQFLQSETRHSDLLFGRDGRWLVVVAMADRDARTVVKRLEAGRERWNKQNPGEALTHVRLRSLGTWRIGVRNDDLVRCFRTLWNGHDVSRAVTGVSAGGEARDPSLERQ